MAQFNSPNIIDPEALTRTGRIANLDSLSGIEQQPETSPDSKSGDVIWIVGRRAVRYHAEAVPDAINENGAGLTLNAQLPEVIGTAIKEWAVHLGNQPWAMRQRAMHRFAECFADNFLAQVPHMDDEEYEGMKEIGYSCLLELFDDGKPFTDADQAEAYLESVHECHRHKAMAWLGYEETETHTLH